MTNNLKTARQLAEELLTGTGLTEKKAESGGVIRDAWVHDRMQQGAKVIQDLCEEVELLRKGPQRRAQGQESNPVLSQQQRCILTMHLLDILSTARAGYTMSDLTGALRTRLHEEFEGIRSTADWRQVIRRFEEEGFVRIDAGLWTSTPAGVLWGYLYELADANAHREDQSILLDKARTADRFDRFANRFVKSAATELRERNLIEYNIRTGQMILSDWCLPLALYAGVKEA